MKISNFSSQEFLVDYAKSTNWSGDNFRAVHDRIQSLAFSINPLSEYSEFVSKYRQGKCLLTLAYNLIRYIYTRIVFFQIQLQGIINLNLVRYN